MNGERALDGHINGKLPARHVDRVLARLATGQQGVVSRRQLAAAGISADTINGALSRQRLIPLHRGVYAVGHRALTANSHWMAAVLACGSGAALSYRSAAAAWGIRPTSRGNVEISVNRELKSRPGIEVHRVMVKSDELTTLHGIPITSPARTLFDLARKLPEVAMEKALDRTEHLKLHDSITLVQLIERYPRSRGVATLRSLLTDRPETDRFTRSPLEARFLTFLSKRDLPLPQTNTGLSVAAQWFEVDCVWWDQGLIVELDARTTHGSRLNFESDRERDRALQVAGWRVIRITREALDKTPEVVAKDLRILLDSARAGS